ncbi:MAG: prepilin-type N-terminal cleavage/methylation domain-containing protein [Planctomycetes bacterium]|nr:prepilin-type N-terminal cleavage/methylation domain-containing protein [Planctomycetota bacterium]
MKNTPRHPAAFTLIELLVVVAIIALLISILLPSLRQARYVAKLTVCSSNQRQIGMGFHMYAGDNTTLYPARPRIVNNTNLKPEQLKSSGSDYRPMIARYVDINKLFNEPLAPRWFDYEQTGTTDITGGYAVWAGWKYIGNEDGSTRLGDTFTYNGNKFSVIISDWETQNFTNQKSESGHNDQQQSLSENTTTLFSRWDGYRRGFMDRNFTFDDLHVERFYNVDYDHTTALSRPMKAVCPWNTKINTGTWRTWLPM